MQIDINVTVGGAEGVDLSTVVGQIADGPYDHENDEQAYRNKTLGDLVAEKIVDRLWAEVNSTYRRDLKKVIEDLRDTVIIDKVTPLVEAALARPIQATNSYGEPNGQTRTLTELIVEQATAELRYTNRPGTGKDTVLTKTIREHIGQALTKELMEAVGVAKKQMVEAIHAQATKFLTDAAIERAVRR